MRPDPIILFLIIGAWRKLFKNTMQNIQYNIATVVGRPKFAYDVTRVWQRCVSCNNICYNNNIFSAWTMITIYNIMNCTASLGRCYRHCWLLRLRDICTRLISPLMLLFNIFHWTQENRNVNSNRMCYMGSVYGLKIVFFIVS